MFTCSKFNNFRSFILTGIVRQFTITSSRNAYENRQSKMLGKLMGKSKKKKVFVSDELPKSVSASKLSSGHRQGKDSNRRINVLNKLFMTNITNLMATETFSQDIVGYGIQVSRVKVSPDFNTVNVFWMAKGDGNDIEIDRILKSMSGALRHELSQLRLMGEVPRISFVKDRHFSKAIEVDNILRTADFGEDFVPTDPTLFMTSLPELEMKLPQEIKAKIIELESENLEEDFEEEPLPEFKNNVLGIDHTEIMKKITKNIDKTKAAWENYEINQFGVERNNEDEITRKSMEDKIDKLHKEAEMRDNFIKFLEKRQRAQKYTPDRKKHHNLVDIESLNEVEDDHSNHLMETDNDFVVEDDHIDVKKLS